MSELKRSGLLIGGKPLSEASLSSIAMVIRADWKKINFGAVPYLDAMRCMETVDQDYGCDSGRSIVAYFLANATSWRGDVAREVKKELNRRIK